MEKRNFTLDGIALIVFTKTLDAPVKTRIARSEGKQVADRIYRELLDATAQVIRELPYHVALVGNESPGELTSIFDRAVSFFPQAGDGLGQRMRNACLHCKDNGASRFIVIGCDCPLRTAGDIMKAARSLENGHNVVLGPVEDGGYHLAGVDMDGLTIFGAVKWGTEELLEETMAIVHKENLKAALLPMRFDIDTIKDYRRWKLT